MGRIRTDVGFLREGDELESRSGTMHSEIKSKEISLKE
jgi:hypothetical protein